MRGGDIDIPQHCAEYNGRLSNCLIFAIRMRIRFGGRIRCFKSLYYHGPHFMWESTCGRFIIDFVPRVKRVGKDGKKRLLPRPFFYGRVRVVVIGKEKCNE